MGLCRGLTTFETLSLTTFGPGFIEAGWGWPEVLFPPSLWADPATVRKNKEKVRWLCINNNIVVKHGVQRKTVKIGSMDITQFYLTYFIPFHLLCSKGPNDVFRPAFPRYTLKH
jgi:hypothetical protein